jgi:hypothetical protein
MVMKNLLCSLFGHKKSTDLKSSLKSDFVTPVIITN